MKTYEIERSLVLSTAHISEATAALLGDHSEAEDFNVVVYAVEYGWLVWADSADFAGAPELSALLKLAREQGCKWIRFDQDGEVVEGLPTFEW